MNKTFLLRTVIGLALSVLSGVAFTLAFPPYELWLLAWVGWVPVLIAQYRIMPRRLSGLATGIAILFGCKVI